MLHLVKTTSDNADFIKLVAKLNTDLAERDGEDHSFYAQFNTIDKLKNVIIAYEANKPVSCGAIKQFNSETVEVKRMFTLSKNRGNGVATKVLVELENWAKDLGYKRCILETGIRQPEAIRLYKKNNYIKTTNYDQYIGIENSVCFEKKL